jgi:hypothetical protein
VKGILVIPLEHQTLDDVRHQLALALAPVLRQAMKDATLKVLVDHQPG